MKSIPLAEKLWGDQAKLSYLMFAAAILLFTCLGGREIWTQEHRWADIVGGMFYRHDFLHPFLGGYGYYDKPLLSYWLIVAATKIIGVFNTWALRLPSALSGLLAIWSLYALGSTLFNKKVGLLAGWLLLTTFYFVFWARTSSADMLNLAGSVFAITWYMQHRTQTNFLSYAVFFLIVALTALCKGLVGAVVPAIAIMIDMTLNQTWRKHCNRTLLLSVLPGAIIYFLPFWASSHFGGSTYQEDGLYLVYRENILRYFKPFDHQGPIYTYFVYLPIYTFPWALFFIPALANLTSRWKQLSINTKWVAWTLLALFLFFTLSGSRRSYYVLPLVPFAILFTAEWLTTFNQTISIRYQKMMASGVVGCFIVLLLTVDVLPAWYYSQFGAGHFASLLKTEAEKTKPWQDWNIVMLDAETKLNFYLQLPPNSKQFFMKSEKRAILTSQAAWEAWPILANKPAGSIFITRKQYQPALEKFFLGYRVVELPTLSANGMFKKQVANTPIAFIPLLS